MLKIRLSRTGKKNDAAFRIVVTEHYKPVKAGFIEHIGFYNPQSKQFQIDKEKLELWMKKGATCSDTINNLLVREKIFAKDKVIKVTRVPKKKEEEEKKENKGEVKEGSVSAEPSPDKTKAKDEKLKEKEAKEKVEAPLPSPEAGSAGSTASPEAKSVEKKPEVDKK